MVEDSVVVAAISIQFEADSSLTAELLHGGDETGAATTGTGAAGAATGVVTIIDSLMTCLRRRLRLSGRWGWGYPYG